MILTLQKRGTITVTSELRKKLGIVSGDTLHADVKNGKLVLTPVDFIPRTLELSPEGVKKETEAEEDIKHGRVKRFDSVEELLKDVEKK